VNYHFEQVDMDTTNRCLTIDGCVVDIDERTFELFTLLIDAYPNECTKQQLTDHIWKDTVVSDWSLSKLVSDTRKNFKKSGYHGPLIHTVHGRGYRIENSLWQLIERDKLLSSESAPPIDQRVVTDNKVSNNRRLLFAFCFLTLVIAMVTLLAIYKDTSLKLQEPANAIGRILWVDDNPKNNLKEQQYLEQQDIGIYTVQTTDEALRLLSLYEYQLVISDMGRADDSLAGLKLLEGMRQRQITTPFLLYTWHATPALISEVREKGGQGVLTDSESLYGQVLPILSH